jgi:hypothetical protein
MAKRTNRGVWRVMLVVAGVMFGGTGLLLGSYIHIK